jgi:hypothetical protein
MLCRTTGARNRMAQRTGCFLGVKLRVERCIPDIPVGKLEQVPSSQLAKSPLFLSHMRGLEAIHIKRSGIVVKGQQRGRLEFRIRWKSRRATINTVHSSSQGSLGIRSSSLSNSSRVVGGFGKSLPWNRVKRSKTAKGGELQV